MSKKGVTLKKSNAEGENTPAKVVFLGSSPSSAQNHVISKEELEATRRSLEESLKRLQGVAPPDEELIRVAIRSRNMIADLRAQLEELNSVKGDIDDPQNFHRSEKELTGNIRSLETQLNKVESAELSIAIGHYNKRARISNELRNSLPSEVFSVRDANIKLKEILEQAVSNGVLTTIPTPSTVQGRNPLTFDRVHYVPKSTQEEVISFFNSCRDFLTVISDVKDDLRKTQKAETAKYICSREEMEQEVEASGGEMVYLDELLLETGLDRVAMVPVIEYDRHLGEMFLTRKVGSQIVAIKATTPVAAEKIFKLTYDEKERWVDERRIEVRLDDNGNPDFEGVKYPLIRESLRKEFQRNLEFQQKRKVETEILEVENPVFCQDMFFGGVAGVGAVKVFGWKSNEKIKPENLVLRVQCDGEKIWISQATEQSWEVPFISDYREPVALDKARLDGRLKALFALGEGWELRRETRKILASREFKNLKGKENLEAFLSADPGQYFLGFPWRDRSSGPDAKPKFINAVLRIDEQGIVSVERILGSFSYRNLSRFKPCPITEVTGILQFILRIMARENDLDVPLFLEPPAKGSNSEETSASE